MKKIVYLDNLKSITLDIEDEVEYYIANGSDLATIDSKTGLLTINECAKNGGTVIVRSRANGFISNAISVNILWLLYIK